MGKPRIIHWLVWYDAHSLLTQHTCEHACRHMDLLTLGEDIPMRPSGMHYFPLTWPFLLVLFLFLALVQV